MLEVSFIWERIRNEVKRKGEIINVDDDISLSAADKVSEKYHCWLHDSNAIGERFYLRNKIAHGNCWYAERITSRCSYYWLYKMVAESNIKLSWWNCWCVPQTHQPIISFKNELENFRNVRFIEDVEPFLCGLPLLSINKLLCIVLEV
jgi:hypothetical protein